MVFHDRRLQYTEHQQLEGWKWNRPGDRLLDIGNGAWHKILPIPLIMCGGKNKCNNKNQAVRCVSQVRPLNYLFNNCIKKGVLA